MDPNLRALAGSTDIVPGCRVHLVAARNVEGTVRADWIGGAYVPVHLDLQMLDDMGCAMPAWFPLGRLQRVVEDVFPTTRVQNVEGPMGYSHFMRCCFDLLRSGHTIYAIEVGTRAKRKCEEMLAMFYAIRPEGTVPTLNASRFAIDSWNFGTGNVDFVEVTCDKDHPRFQEDDIVFRTYDLDMVLRGFDLSLPPTLEGRVKV